MGMFRKALRIAAAAAITAVGIGVIAWICRRPTSNDYIEYWSAGQLLAHRANPYSARMILALEKSKGFLLDSPLIMLNPPWALFLVAPLGYCSAMVGLLLWTMAAASAILASLLLIDVPPKLRMPAFLFVPVIVNFTMQQSSAFLLLGFCLFLRFHRRRPFWAGASLLLMAIKPHLFAVFWVVLLVDCLYRRRYSILIGLAASLGSASALAMLLTPGVWQDYFLLIRSSALDQNFYPTLATLLRVAIDVRLAWLALLPAAAAAAWGLAFYWKRRKTWDWRREGGPVMLATLLTSPYGWVSDQVVLLPALSSAIERGRSRYAVEILVVIDCAALLCTSVRSLAAVCMPAAWLAWYLYATRESVNNRAQGSGSEAGSGTGLELFRPDAG